MEKPPKEKREEIEDIVNPEVPKLPEERRELLARCLAVIAAGGSVVGISPRHVSIEGMRMIKWARAAKDNPRL